MSSLPKQIDELFIRVKDRGYIKTSDLIPLIKSHAKSRNVLMTLCKYHDAIPLKKRDQIKILDYDFAKKLILEKAD